MLWRACRGNVFLRQAEIETPLEDPSTVRINLLFYLYQVLVLKYIKIIYIVIFYFFSLNQIE